MLRQRFVITLAAFALTAAGANAGPIVHIIEQNYGAHSFVTVHRNGVGVTVPAGQFQIRLSSNPSQIINTFCVDFDHSGPAPYQVEIRSTNDGLSHGPELAYLYNKYGATTLNDNILAAAIQVAMFDLQEDGGDGLTTGFFQDLQGDAIAQLAQQLIDEALGQSGETTWFDASLNGNEPNRGQSMIGGEPRGSGGNEIPEPATFVLLGLGAAGLGLVGWRARGKWATS